jgi:hypothetical protein
LIDNQILECEMKKWMLTFLLLSFVLSACAVTAPSQPPLEQEQPKTADLPDLGAAPELTNEVWLNTETPLRLVDLRGKVVLLDMWTFG